MRHIVVKSVIAAVFAALVVGCGGGATTIEMDGGLAYTVPDGFSVNDAEITGTSAKMMSAENEKIAGAVTWNKAEAGSGLGSNKTSLFARYMSLGSNLTTAETKIKAETWVGGMSLVSKQSFSTPYVFSIAYYKLVTNDKMKPMEVASKIVSALADGNATGFPVADASAPDETAFRLVLLAGEYKGVVFYIPVVIPESMYTKYQTYIDAMTTGSRVGEKSATLSTDTETFKQSGGAAKADFLFVVDDSGSMSDNQDALSKAAEDFSSEVGNSGIQYRSAIITTSSGIDDLATGDANRILNDVGIIENNDTLLKQKLVAGTGGSYTETGIWNAERALQANGSITKKGMPASGATLSVIILSDEKSQYTSRSTGGSPFDPSNNLFVSRKIKVYSIIDTDQNPVSQYDDLSMATNGMYSDIKKDSSGNLDFSAIMQRIAQDAGGAASAFKLSHTYVNIDEVKVDGSVVSNSSTNGWTANQSSNSIVFHGSAVPAAGSAISVTYTYWP